MSEQEAYQELLKHVREAALLGSVGGVLGWDERTYMPKAGSAFRAEQLGFVAGLTHEKATNPRIGELLAKIESTGMVKANGTLEAANVREIRRDYDRNTKLPKELVEEITRVTTLAQGKWVEARKNSDFKAFLPWLSQVIDLTKKQADALGYKKERYDALLDLYEPEVTSEEVATVFAALRADLVTLNQKIAGASKRPDESIIERQYDVEKQRIFGEAVAEAIGFDFNAGRLDITTHPFCSGFGINDTRITTRYNPKRFNDAFFGIMHEAGHALYEMGIDKQNHFGSPLGEAASLGIHESQSRMWENQVGRSREFWVYFLPQAKRIFRESLGDVSLDQWYGAINASRPSFIRVEADEATYNLHILLRFELERAIMSDQLQAADIPGEWNSRFEKYFGLKVDKDSNGCLQDVHWSAGLMGYFPTYSLGNLYSAQFFAKAKQDIPGLTDQFTRGEFSSLLNWLRTNIHVHGRRYSSNQLGERVTGHKLSHKPLVEYMQKKYGEIYGI